MPKMKPAPTLTPAVEFFHGTNFAIFQKNSLAAWVRICRKINLYPNPRVADYEYRTEYSTPAAGNQLNVRLVSNNLAQQFNINFTPNLNLTGTLMKGLLMNKGKASLLALSLSINWEWQVHEQISPEKNPGENYITPVAQLLFDTHGKLAAARLTVKSPVMVKIHHQLQGVAREIVYYKKCRELRERYHQEEHKFNEKIQGWCARDNLITAAGINPEDYLDKIPPAISHP